MPGLGTPRPSSKKRQHDDGETIFWAVFIDRVVALLLLPLLGAALIFAVATGMGFALRVLAPLIIGAWIASSTLSALASKSARPGAFLVLRSLILGSVLLVLIRQTGGVSSALWPLFVLHTLFAAAIFGRYVSIAVATTLYLGAVGLLAAEHFALLPSDAAPPKGNVTIFRGLIMLSVIVPGLVALRWMIDRSEHQRQVLHAANETLRENASRGRALLDAVTAFSSSARLSEALDEALPLIGKAAAAELVVILMSDRHDDQVEPIYAIDVEGRPIDIPPGMIRTIMQRGPGPAIEAMRTLCPVVIEDILAEGDDYSLQPVAERFGVRGCILLPLVRPSEGVSFGVLSIAYAVPFPGSERDVEFLQTAAASISSLLTNAALLEQLQSLNERLEERVAERTQELTAAQEQLLRAGRLTAMGELAAGVAHELNTPLGTISGYSQFAEERLAGTPGTEEVVRYVDIIRNEAARCSTIVRNLLQFTRASSVDMVPVDMEATVRHAIDLVRHHLEMHRVSLSLSVAADVPLVRARPDQLVQIFTNLMINAQQAMPDGGELRISIEPSSSRDGFVALSFADTGSGIPREYVHRVFEPFFTTKPMGQGTGLGLAVSYSLVQQHGGDIEVESLVGAGTTLRVLLPANRAGASGNLRSGEAA